MGSRPHLTESTLYPYHIRVCNIHKETKTVALTHQRKLAKYIPLADPNKPVNPPHDLSPSFSGDHGTMRHSRDWTGQNSSSANIIFPGQDLAPPPRNVLGEMDRVPSRPVPSRLVSPRPVPSRATLRDDLARSSENLPGPYINRINILHSDES